MIIASAANLLMITGHFDLSVGERPCLLRHHARLPDQARPAHRLSIVVSCAAAVVWGAINGIMVGVLRITPVIATMGTMYAARGFAYLIARWDGGANISAGLPVNFTNFGRIHLFGVLPLVIVFMVVAIAVFFFVEKKTVLGRYSFAIGGNRSAAALSGINVVGDRSFSTSSSASSPGSAASSRSRGSAPRSPTSRRAWSSTSWWPSSWAARACSAGRARRSA